MDSFNTLKELIWLVLIAVELALFTKFFKKVRWSTRIKGLIVGFCISLTFVAPAFLNTKEMGPGGGIIIVFPLIGAIVGYFVGLVIDLTRKNK